MLLSLAFSLALLSPAMAESGLRPPLQLGIYYESLCGDCLHFIVNQLNVTFAAVPEILSVTLVPWGKSNQSAADGLLHCQHGAEECRGNRLHGCVIDALQDPALRMRTVACLENGQKTLEESGPACLAEAGLDWAEQDACAKSDASLQKMLQYGEMTHLLEPALTFVPTVTLDGDQGSKVEQKEMVEDLLNFVCRTWQRQGGQMPAGCP